MAGILGVHPQTVAKMVARGELTSRGPSGLMGSLDRDEVLAVSVARRGAAERKRRERETRAGRQRISTEQPPDDEHAWLRTLEAAEFMGVSTPAISKRARRGRLPYVEHGGRRWFRRDHLELVKHADLVKRPRSSRPR